MQFLPFFALLTACLTGVQAAFSDDCVALAGRINIANATVTNLNFLQNGTLLNLTGNDATCTRPNQTIYGGDICRIALNYTTGNLSAVLIEAFFPANWNGRFLATGTGGVSGCLQYEDVAYGASFGFATVGTNAGHNGTSGRPFDISLGVIEDFSYRAIHLSAVVGKQLVSLLYSRNQTYSYYLSCSTGGRQGFKEAQMYPDDFNGIVAGAPALDFSSLNGWSAWQTIVTGFDVNSTDFVSSAQWGAVREAIMRQCDGLDGAVDGILEDPSLCRPIISSMICAANATNRTTCLNGGQAARVARVYQDMVGSNSTILYPGMQPGAELLARSIYWSGAIFPYPNDYFKYAIYHNASFDVRNLSIADIEYANRLNPGNVSSFNPNLSIFNRTGGKIIHYHGQQDAVITSSQSARYYERVAANLSASPAQLDSFYRYFRIGGMNHCNGGPGAWDIGQKYFGRPAANNTADNNVLLAIVRWVENGTAPNTVTGYNYGTLPAYGVVNGSYSRRHCRYPLRNMKTGNGSYTDPNSWQCM